MPGAAWAGGGLLSADWLPRPAGWWMTAVWWSPRLVTWTTRLRSSEVSPLRPPLTLLPRGVLGVDAARAQRVGQAGRPQPSCLWNPRRPRTPSCQGGLSLHFHGGTRCFSGAHHLWPGACPPLTSPHRPGSVRDWGPAQARGGPAGGPRPLLPPPAPGGAGDSCLRGLVVRALALLCDSGRLPPGSVCPVVRGRLCPPRRPGVETLLPRTLLPRCPAGEAVIGDSL